MSTAAAAPAAVMVPAPRPSLDDVGAVAVLPVLFVPETSQWLSSSSGRIAGDGYSWMQAVHWVAGSGLYRPRRHRSHGPRSFGPTTVRVAQELTELFPCRPGIDYLVRRTGLSERSVEYHLGMLRETGLLAWIVQGTRISGGPAQASEFARMIPPEFDAALGIRTVQRDETAPAYTRAASGIAEAGRELMAKLAAKASRKVRKPQSKTSSKTAARGAEQRVVTPVSGEARCTPMQVGTSACPSAGTSTSPSETKLASGSGSRPTQKKTTSGPRKLNRIGRRFQLGRELVVNVPWLSKASVQRVSWIARHCADAGWTWHEVRAAAEEHSPIDPTDARRPSGLLAHRLKGVHRLYASPAARRLLVTAWEDSRAQERFRHAGWDAAPALATTAAADQAMHAIHTTLNQPAPDQDLPLLAASTLDITTISAEEVLEHRALGAADPDYVLTIHATLGDHDTRRLLTNRIVDQALAATRHTPTPILAPAF